MTVREHCAACLRQRPEHIADPTCSKGGYCYWVTAVCLGRPVGYTGGPVAWCGVPVRKGCRFCARCYALRLADIESEIRTNVALLHRSRHALSALQLEGPGT